RPDTLFQVLDALQRQLDPPSCEVVVVDDGSRDDTSARLGSYKPSYPFRFFSQGNRGPAAARNRGVEEARGRYVLFLGDDTVPEAALLAAHAAAHAEKGDSQAAVLGYTTWPHDRRVSPFLHHINEYGLQFGYGLIEDSEEVPFNFFYTSNISLPRALLLEAGLFVTTFSPPASGGIEMAYLPMKMGMKILFFPPPPAGHPHPPTLFS